MKRLIGPITLAAVTLAGLTACEPPPPPPVLVVNDKAYGDDATLGDGICETDPGNGICTLDAAIQEANALGRAVIQVPEVLSGAGGHDPHLVSDTTITGHITLVSTHVPMRNPMATIEGPGLRVQDGGSLKLANLLYVTKSEDRSAHEVDGTMSIDSAFLMGEIDVRPTGHLLLANSYLMSDWRSPPVDRATIVNHGEFTSLYSVFTALETMPLVDTGPGGTTRFAASGISPFAYPSSIPACVGKSATSLGYNIISGCGFSEDGDIDYVPDDPEIVVDRIPYGVLGCGSNTDVAGNPRPVDYDGNGIAACDVGPEEHEPGSIYVPDRTTSETSTTDPESLVLLGGSL